MIERSRVQIPAGAAGEFSDTHRKIVFHHVSQVAFCFASLKLACSLDEQCFMLEHKSAAL